MLDNHAGNASATPNTSASTLPTSLRTHYAELMLLGVAAIWGSSYAVVKQVTLQMAVLEFLTIRFGITALFLLPALRPIFTQEWRKTLYVGGTLGATLLAVFLCETFGVSMTSATNAAFLISLCVVLTPFTEWLVFGNRPHRHSVLAALACVAGALLMIQGSLAQPLSNVGDWLMIAAAFFRAMMVTYTKRLSNWHPVPALTLTAIQSVVVSLGALYILSVTKALSQVSIPDDSSFWLRMLFLVLFCTIFAFFAQNHAAANSSPSRVALLMGSEPLFGALFGVAILGETLTLSNGLGAVLIIFSTAYVLRLGK